MCPPPDDSPQPFAASAPSPELHEFSPEERAVLLQLAHAAIAAALEKREISLAPPSPHLAEPRGAFTTLYYCGRLRGCVGYVFPVASLYRTVAESARGAAFDDTRFPPVKPEEAVDLEISLSILSAPKPVAAEEVEIGRHGLMVRMGPYRGLLLPQVPVERAWDRLTFLEETCKKAGLAPNAWQNGAKLEAFTAEVFGDHKKQK